MNDSDINVLLKKNQPVCIPEYIWVDMTDEQKQEALKPRIVLGGIIPSEVSESDADINWYKSIRVLILMIIPIVGMVFWGIQADRGGSIMSGVEISIACTLIALAYDKLYDLLEDISTKID